MGSGYGDRELGWQRSPVPERSLLGRLRHLADSASRTQEEFEGALLYAAARNLGQVD